MSPRRWAYPAAAASIWCALAAGAGGQEQQNARGADVLRASCLTCHGADLIAQQRLSRDGWARELDKMTGWGAALAPDDRDALLGHLTASFGSAAAPAAAEPGTPPELARCVGCHDLGLIAQQRLDADGWRREIDKMIGWGASVTAAEKEALAVYLARRYRS